MKTFLVNVLRRLLRFRLAEGFFAMLLRDRTWESTMISLAPSHLLYPPGSLRRVERHGINYVLDLSELVDWWIFMGLADPVVTVLQTLLEPGMTCIDCGANMGYVSFAMAQEVGPSGRVYSFEPFPGNASRFSRNLEANSLPHVELHRVGVGAEPGQSRMLEVSKRNAGMNRISGTATEGIPVELVTLDGFVESKQLARVDLIKMDVEGYEFEVLRGGIGSLRRFRPMLVFELDDSLLAKFGAAPRDVLSQLEDLDYRLTNVADGLPVTSNMSLEGIHVDVVATPRGKNSWW